MPLKMRIRAAECRTALRPDVQRDLVPVDARAVAHPAAGRVHRLEGLVALLVVLLGLEQPDRDGTSVVGVDEQREAGRGHALRRTRAGARVDLLRRLAKGVAVGALPVHYACVHVPLLSSTAESRP